ncbi:MAG: TAXI family TRAP transporter solute-binding subunit [Spirochaetales bacterium]|uniref:TAXI family TRAP transporter solute-binding subunit n=1 Tax=Candidatus Thalassospirochaeta sargassi TaxID=3119039 RepID=A0AAJ1MJW0_9SPIO|nr:TAXI family TRAP transporter solute-binding subunit [Spirochaetales bacterium]
MSFKKKSFAVLLSVLVIAMISSCSKTDEAEAQTANDSKPKSAGYLDIGTNPSGSLFYTMGVSLSKVLIEEGDLQFRVAPYAGSSTFIPMINSGELDFGLSNGGEATFAYEGIEVFDGKANPNIRIVAATIPNYAGFAVATESDAKTIADLKGKKISSEYSGGRTFHYYSEALLGASGVSSDDFQLVPTPSFVTAIKNFSQGIVDAAIITLNVSAGKEAMATMSEGWRYLNIDYDGELPDISEYFPSAKLTLMSPADDATGVVDDPTVMIETKFFLICGSHVPDDVVYEVVKTLYSNKEAMVEAYGNFKRFAPESMNSEVPVPYHPGALKFYEEMGMID